MQGTIVIGLGLLFELALPDIYDQHTLKTIPELALQNATVFGILLYGRHLANKSWKKEFLASEIAREAVAKERAASEQARENAREDAEFAIAVSHEIRTPLAGISSLVENLKDGVKVNVDDYLSAVFRNTVKLNRLVDNLLLLGKAKRGQIQYYFEPIDLINLVRTVIADFEATKHPATHCVDLTCHAATLPIKGDTATLSTVIWNLLDNAVKYSPGKDKIWIELRSGESRITLSIRDQGIGISASDRPFIFKRFVRGKDVKQSVPNGAGVGLSLSLDIIKAHDGDIVIESEAGSGSTFIVILPKG